MDFLNHTPKSVNAHAPEYQRGINDFFFDLVKFSEELGESYFISELVKND